MRQLWQRLEFWLLDHTPAKCFASLGPPATETALRELETTLGVELPADIRESYQIHDGQRREGRYLPSLIDGREFLSLGGITAQWTCWKQLLDRGAFDDNTSTPSSPAIRNGWWEPQWIPLTYDGAGNHDCLDLAPAEGGTVGQMISFWHDDDERSLLAPSFSAWFATFVEQCECGEYVYAEDYNGIVLAKYL